jgi:hypothetical protein
MSRDSGPEQAVCLGASEPNEEVADAEDQGCLAAGRTACRCAEIAAGLGVRQSTLSEYLERAARDGLPLPKALTYATLEAMLFSRRAARPGRFSRSLTGRDLQPEACGSVTFSSIRNVGEVAERSKARPC